MGTETLQQRQRGDAPSPALSGDELTAVLEEANRLHGEAIKLDAATPSPGSVDQAFALAEELGIPEEHVRAALAAQQRKKAPEGGGTTKSLVVAGGGGVLAAVGLKLVGLPLFLAVVVAALVAAGIFAVGLLKAMAKRHPVKPAGPPPVPGTCRVCLRPAYTAVSTFCDEHRYRPPGEREGTAPPPSR